MIEQDHRAIAAPEPLVQPRPPEIAGEERLDVEPNRVTLALQFGFDALADRADTSFVSQRICAAGIRENLVHGTLKRAQDAGRSLERLIGAAECGALAH